MLTMARCRTWAEWLRPRRKYQTMALVFFVLLVGFVWMLTATPAHAIVNEIVNGVIRVLSYVMLSVAHIAIGFTLFFLRFFINLASYNGYIDAPIVVVGWTMVRDIANMFFVVIMLVIAFATILGLEQYEWRKLLVKLLLMAIFINFSNMIAQLVIDIAHVFTITFLNAISAAAGGNLINMFKLEKIVSIVGATPDFTSAEDFGVNILVASMAATFFAILSATTMGAYAFAMAIRVVVLWVAIILAPLAFVLAVLPATQSKAQEWWKEFSHHVLAAPIMVFFLWLAFATLGQGDAIQQIEQGASERLSIASAEPPKLSLSEVTSWENMASFFVAMAFLWIGIEKVQELGIRGGGVIGGAIGFAKKVATIATGYAAGRWLVGKGTDTMKTGLSAAAWYAPWVGGEKISNWLKRQGHSIRGAYYGTAMQPQKGILGKVLGSAARSAIASEKALTKTQKQSDVRKEIIWKRTGSEAGGAFFMRRGTEGMREAQDRIERGWLQGEEMRSKSKDAEYETLGKLEVLSQPRYKYNVDKKTAGFEESAGTMAQRVTDHEQIAEQHKAAIERLQNEARLNIIVGGREFSRDYGRGFGGVERGGTISHESIVEAQAMAKIKHEELSHVEEESLNNAMSRKDKGAVLLDGAANLVHAGVYDANAQGLQQGIKDIDTQIANLSQAQNEVDRLVKDREGKEAALMGLEQPISDFDQALETLFKKRDAFNEVIDEKGEVKDKFKGQYSDADVKKMIRERAEVSGQIDDLNQRKLAAEDALKVEGDPLKQLISNLNEQIEGAKLGAAAEQENNKDEIKRLKDEKDKRSDTLKGIKDGLGQVADEIRKGNLEVVNRMRDQAKQAGDDVAVKNWERVAVAVQDGAADAWRAGTAAGTAREAKREFGYRHNLLLSEAEQRVVWDKRGIDTPKSTLTELIEEFEKTFKELSYEQYVESSGPMILKMLEKTKNGTITEGDKAALAGLFKRAMDESWVDDTIISIMKNSETREKLGSIMGWKDQEFSPEKIRDVEMLFASGGNVEFARDHAVVGNILDKGMDLGMDVAGVYEGIRTGQFKNTRGENMTVQMREHMQEMSSKLTEDQNKLWNRFFDGAQKAENEGFMKNYLGVMRENQSQMQFLGNLRNQAIGNKHAENAGWSLYHDAGGGEKMYVAAGVRMARDHVMTDVNKISQADRSKFHPHTMANLDETTGVLTQVRTGDYARIRNGIIDTRTYGGTSPRLIKQLMGAGAGDELGDFLDQQGRFRVGASAAAHTTWGNIDTRIRGASLKQKQALTAQNIVRSVYAPQMAGNIKDFLLTTSASSNVSQLDAINEGKMNLMVPILNKDGSVTNKHYTNVNQLITDYNKGAFGEVTEKISKFQPQKMSADARAALEDAV